MVRKKWKQLPQEKIDKIRKLYPTHTTGHISKMLGVCRGTVKKYGNGG